MNQVQIVGRLTKDPVTSYSGQQNAVARFTVAVDRMPDKNGNKQSDFIGCVAFGKTAEFIEKYFKKGKGIALNGSIRTGSYEKNGQKVYTTDILAERVEFVPSDSVKDAQPDVPAPSGFHVTDEDIPF